MIDPDKILAILDELEAEYLRLGTSFCKNLTEETRLTAFLLLGLHSTSLLKSASFLLQTTVGIAGCDAVERAFLEASHLQFEFRFLDSRKKIEEWFARKGDSWKSDKGKLNSFCQAQKGNGFGREYGDFSLSTHPTADACRSSALVTGVLGIHADPQQLPKGLKVRSGNFLNLLFREIWSALKDEPRLIPIPVDRTKLPLCVSFSDAFIELQREYEQRALSAQL